MPPQKPLSKKKITQQTISISPALKDKIEKYVNENSVKNPNDKRFKSISAFYNYVLEKTMECFEQGKTLDDFETLVDKEIKDFFDNITFNAIIPYYENAVKTNRYTSPTFEKIPFFYLTLRKMYLAQMDPYDFRSIKNIFNRVRNYIFSQNITKKFNLDIFIGKNRKDYSGVFEYAGFYENLTFENCKYNAALFGLLGVKITNFLYSKKNKYFRFDLRTTDLFFRNELLKKERLTLINHNLSYLLNYLKIIDGKDYYLWMKLANDKQVIISFNKEETQNEWVNLIEQEIEKSGDKEEYILNILKLFEKLHWIKIQSEKDLNFVIRLSKSKFSQEKEFLLDTLSKKSEISHENGIYYLKKIDS